MSFSKYSLLVFLALSSLTASAGEGRVTQTLDLLPKTIRREVYALIHLPRKPGHHRGFASDADVPRSVIPAEGIPLAGSHKCGGRIFHRGRVCYDAPEQIEIVQELVLDPRTAADGSTRYYRAVSLSGIYELNGIKHPARVTAVPGTLDVTVSMLGVRLPDGKEDIRPTEWRMHELYFEQRSLNSVVYIGGRLTVDGNDRGPDDAEQIEHNVLRALADSVSLGQMDSLRAFAEQARVLREFAVEFDGDTGAGFIDANVPWQMGLRLSDAMERQAAELTEQGHAVVGRNGECDQALYTALLDRIQGWTIGSVDYFDANDALWKGMFAQGTKLDAFGIRQKLKAELSDTVARFCERQGSGRSRVAELLND